jgi:hypothetical protein
MKLFIDRKNRRFVKSAASNVVLDRMVLKRRDLVPLEVVFVENGAVVATPSGTTITAALKRNFSDANFLAVAESGTLNLNTVPLEAAFASSPASVPAFIEIRWAVSGEATRTATLQADVQNSVILGTEGTPSNLPDGKATQTEATTGTDNEKWMTPLRTAQAIAQLAPPTTNASLLTSGTLPDVRLSSTVTTSLGKADTALQPSALTPYRTSSAQDLIDAGKQPAGSYATAAQGAKADSALQSGTAISNISGLQTALDGKQAAGSYAPATGINPAAITGTAVVDSDSRLSNSRQPNSHKSTHATGGADALTPSDIGAVDKSLSIALAIAL